MTSRINGKNALVTGGTRGIGFAIAQALAERGSSVFICGTNPQGLEEAISLLRKRGKAKIEGAVCDVRDHAQVRSMVRNAADTLGSIDILVNNAGIGVFNKVEKMDPEEWRATLETNLSGVFYCCHEAIPLMKRAGGGYIINIGSLAGKNAFPEGAAYNASKFGLIGFSEALMQEVRYDHIRVSYVMPGSVDTDFGRSPRDSVSGTWKLSPEDVAQTVLNLLELDPRALASRVELRPSEPNRGRPT
jgi:NAD(P)-dependent dehydrogenase (short-subunit alcohol dehydrogenase family)